MPRSRFFFSIFQRWTDATFKDGLQTPSNWIFILFMGKLMKIGDDWGWMGMNYQHYIKKWNMTVFLHDSTIPWVARDPGVRPRRVMGRDKPRFQGHQRNFWMSTEVAEKNWSPATIASSSPGRLRPFRFSAWKMPNDETYDVAICSWSKSIKEEHP